MGVLFALDGTLLDTAPGLVASGERRAAMMTLATGCGYLGTDDCPAARDADASIRHPLERLEWREPRIMC